MADFELHAEIISRCIGYKPGEFVRVYHENQKLQTEFVIEGSPIAFAITRLMQDHKEDGWSGTATQLLIELEYLTDELRINTKSRSWVKSASALTRKINEVKTALRENNIDIVYDREGSSGTRIIRIQIMSSVSSGRQFRENSHSNFSPSVENSDGTDCFSNQISSVMSSVKAGQSHAQNGLTDGTDGTDGILRIDIDPYTEKYEFQGVNKGQNCLRLGMYNKEYWGMERTSQGSDYWKCTFPKCKVKGDVYTVYAHANAAHEEFKK